MVLYIFSASNQMNQGQTCFVAEHPYASLGR